MTIDTLLNESLSLDVSERAGLIKRLLLSLDVELSVCGWMKQKQDLQVLMRVFRSHWQRWMCLHE